MQRLVAISIGRQHFEHGEGALWRANFAHEPQLDVCYKTSKILDHHLSSSSDEAIPAYEELFLYACPKFIVANPPPYDDPEALAASIEDHQIEPAQRHLALFLSDVRSQSSVPTLRSFLKLYTSIDAQKLASFTEDADEEDMVQQLMVLKQSSRRIGRVVNAPGASEASASGKGSLLDGETITTSDLDFVIDGVCCFSCHSTMNTFS